MVADMLRNHPLLKQFGGMLKRLRDERGLSQHDLAVRSGMTAKHVGEIERGVAEPSITAIAALANGLRVKMSALMPDTEGALPERPRASFAKWKALYDATREWNEAARQALGLDDTDARS
jgi:transcriptional regulator with XRE-family HTH domain